MHLKLGGNWEDSLARREVGKPPPARSCRAFAVPKWWSASRCQQLQARREQATQGHSRQLANECREARRESQRGEPWARLAVAPEQWKLRFSVGSDVLCCSRYIIKRLVFASFDKFFDISSLNPNTLLRWCSIEKHAGTEEASDCAKSPFPCVKHIWLKCVILIRVGMNILLKILRPCHPSLCRRLPSQSEKVYRPHTF